MAKKPQQPSAPPPPTEPEELDPLQPTEPEGSGPAPDPELEIAAATSASTPATYEVQWRLDGFADEPLQAGDQVEATPEDAAPFVACGVLKPLQELV